jgi:hypothetical protein
MRKRRHKNTRDEVDKTQNNNLLVSWQEENTETLKMKSTKHEIPVWQQDENLRLLKQCSKNRVMKTIKHEVTSTWQQEENTRAP